MDSKVLDLTEEMLEVTVTVKHTTFDSEGTGKDNTWEMHLFQLRTAPLSYQTREMTQAACLAVNHQVLDAETRLLK